MLQDDIAFIRDVLQRERAWREIVFAGRNKRDQKVGEIDQALDALSRIEARLKETHPGEFLQQEVLL